MGREEREELWNELSPLPVEQDLLENITVGKVTDGIGKEFLLDFIELKMDKAREEGYRKGAEDMFDELELFPIPKDYLKKFVSKLKDNK